MDYSIFAFHRLRAEGKQIDEITKIFKISKPTLYRYLARDGYKTSQQPQAKAGQTPYLNCLQDIHCPSLLDELTQKIHRANMSNDEKTTFLESASDNILQLSRTISNLTQISNELEILARKT